MEGGDGRRLTSRLELPPRTAGPGGQSFIRLAISNRVSQLSTSTPWNAPAAPRAMSAGTSLTWKRKSPHITGVKQEADDAEFVRKKIKLSDLPIGGPQRSAIDQLLLKFKKSGEFDKLRKAVFAQFESSVRDFH
jgi:hypothetical protein